MDFEDFDDIVKEYAEEIEALGWSGQEKEETSLSDLSPSSYPTSYPNV